MLSKEKLGPKGCISHFSDCCLPLGQELRFPWSSTACHVWNASYVTILTSVASLTHVPDCTVLFCTLPDEAEARWIVTVHMQFSNGNSMAILLLEAHLENLTPRCITRIRVTGGWGTQVWGKAEEPTRAVNTCVLVPAWTHKCSHPCIHSLQSYVHLQLCLWVLLFFSSYMMWQISGHTFLPSFDLYLWVCFFF